MAASIQATSESQFLHPAWFDARKLGVIIHWGIYSVLGYDDVPSAKTRKIGNGSEWYYRRLTGPMNFQAPSGSKETRAWHHEHYGDMPYEDLSQFLTASEWNPHEWVTYWAAQGVQYIIITAKHHDGFCMWPNGRKHRKSGKPWNVGDVGPMRDIVGELADAVRAAGLAFGVYYSLMEWDYPSTLKSFDYVHEIVHRDLEDLHERYHPTIWWCDGDWTRTMAAWNLDAFWDKVRAEGAITNDRLGKDTPKDGGDFQNHGDRYMPKRLPVTSKWENVMTIGYSWGINYTQTAKDYKSGAQLIDLFRRTLSMWATCW